MKTTKLLEFKNQRQQILRGILVFNSKKTPKALVISLPGFAGTASAGRKFKVLSDELLKENIASFRFDPAGHGLSDGKISELTVRGLAGDLTNALMAALKSTKKELPIAVVAHSLGACVLAQFLKENPAFPLVAAVLFAPALNQKLLIPLWTEQEMSKDPAKKTAPAVWADYKKYFSENQAKNYESLLKPFLEKCLLIHGEKDSTVPLEMITLDFPNKLIVKNGDHKLEELDMRREWLKPALDFLKKSLS